jgi:hypothetical protein
MAQADNTVQITGRVVRGPFVSYVNGDSTKMRVKYQVLVASRKRDNNQTFCPWVRTLGNQAKKDYENIRTGDVVTVLGRIVTRIETKKRYYVIDDAAAEKAVADDPDGSLKDKGIDAQMVANAAIESTQPSLREIDSQDDDVVEELNEKGKVIFTTDERRMVTEIQGDDVRYFSRWLGDMTEDDLKKLLTDKVIDEAVKRVIERKLAEEKEKALAKPQEIQGVEDTREEDAQDDDEGPARNPAPAAPAPTPAPAAPARGARAKADPFAKK